MEKEIIHKEGLLFDMVVDHMELFVKRNHIRHLLIRYDKTGDYWGLLYTDLGKTFLIEKNELRKIQLNYLINKTKKGN